MNENLIGFHLQICGKLILDNHIRYSEIGIRVCRCECINEFLTGHECLRSFLGSGSRGGSLMNFWRHVCDRHRGRGKSLVREIVYDSLEHRLVYSGLVNIIRIGGGDHTYIEYCVVYTLHNEVCAIGSLRAVNGYCSNQALVRHGCRPGRCIRYIPVRRSERILSLCGVIYHRCAAYRVRGGRTVFNQGLQRGNVYTVKCTRPFGRR